MSVTIKPSLHCQRESVKPLIRSSTSLETGTLTLDLVREFNIREHMVTTRLPYMIWAAPPQTVWVEFRALAIEAGVQGADADAFRTHSFSALCALDECVKIGSTTLDRSIDRKGILNPFV